MFSCFLLSLNLIHLVDVLFKTLTPHFKEVWETSKLEEGEDGGLLGCTNFKTFNIDASLDVIRISQHFEQILHLSTQEFPRSAACNSFGNNRIIKSTRLVTNITTEMCS